MDSNQLNQNLNQIGVTPPDVLRASLYINYLTQAQTYFNNTMAGGAPGGLGPNYAFVRNAVCSTNLLNELAKVLDFFVAPAVAVDLRRVYAPGGGGGGWNYSQYFDNVILNAIPGTYNANVAAFMARYPITNYALNQLATNFQNNILEACQRVIADRQLLTNFYSDLYEDLAINSLNRIKSTGSDFHKGGKQVLILTFDISYYEDYRPPVGPVFTRKDLKVVYKPSDLEVDCLIAGDSAAINRVIPNFMVNSLFEIYNNRLQIHKNGNPAFTGEPLNTYRILPRNFISAYGGGYPLPIRQAYGYIQYLNYDLSGTAQEIWGYYPYGESDYLIFKSFNEDEITRSFHRKEGAYSALACSFSLVDTHQENLRVNKYKPYPIDLEISLTQQVNTIRDTSLIDYTTIGPIGGINGRFSDDQVGWEIRNFNVQGQASIREKRKDVYHQNRLWKVTVNNAKKLISVDQNDLLQGFIDGMDVLRACQQNGDFNIWFARLNNIVIRYLPAATSEFKNIRDYVVLINEAGVNPNAAFLTTLQEKLRNKLTEKFNQYVINQDPNFIAMTQAESLLDYQNLDIPVFYHRIGTLDIINSRGQQVQIPQTVTIDNPAGGTRNARVLGIGGVLNRNTFFANLPTQVNVNQGQVQILGGGGFAARVNVIQTGIINELAMGEAGVSAASNIIRPI